MTSKYPSTKAPLGMYHLDEIPFGKLQLGGHTLTKNRTGKIWIREDASGEGGEFSEAALAKVIKEFYDKNF